MRGFKYMSSVTVYAHLQACGMVNNHLEGAGGYGGRKKLSGEK